MKSDTVWRLLRHNISVMQIAGYALANVAGLAIVIAAIQFYRDISSVWNTEDSFISRDYLIISKKVEGLGSLFGSADTGFTPGEIADIEAQPWVRRAGQFTASDYNVYASVEMGGRGMSTALFFESIPSDFFDIMPREWRYTPGSSDAIPIIISKDYLTLYNFGFAASRGLPQISEGMISMIPLRISLSGNGQQQWFPARIVGFSSRLNTIAVPEEFMTWANSTYGEHPDNPPSRLIMEVSKPGDPDIDRYLDSHGYESAGDKADSGRASYFLSVVTTVVICVGAVISLLAFFILTLSIFLLLQKNREKLRDLMALGYTPARVARYYYTIVGSVNAAVFLCALIIMLCARSVWSSSLTDIGITPTPPFAAAAIGLAIILFITAGNFIAIRRTVTRNFRG